DVIIQYHPEFYHGEPDRQEALKAASMRRLEGVWDTLDRALSQGPFFFGARPAVPDFLLALQTVWDVIFPDGDITRWPNITRHRAAVCARPAVQRIRAAHEAEFARRRAAGV
ncbi:MAG: glutathione S-transferase C-terminal domain-containing protein, partial [Rhodobacteraceae bacterium]|nr:glutathione S-transferase C-terminal domain-containing protein [Paracoccaceae bacterium]